MAYERQLEDNLYVLRDELRSGNYRHGAYCPFTINDPKRRSISKATVKDRVVHQALVNIIEPYFERRFIHDSYSCRIDKGTHAAVRRLQIFLRRISENNTRTVYALKCDVRKFFASVDHNILFSLLGSRITDKRTVNLLKNIIDSFGVSAEKGIPLGNLTSQLFANIYLNELDRYIKMHLREKFYLRYCDDFIILDSDCSRLKCLIGNIDAFLKQRLSLMLHPNKVSIRSWSQGIDFLGYVSLPYCTVVRTKTAHRVLLRVTKNNLTSYIGVCSHADAYVMKQIIFTKILSSNI